MLFYEEGTNFCHRHIVAYWLEITLGIKVDEVSTLEDGTLVRLPRPEYLKEILLEEMEKIKDLA